MRWRLAAGTVAWVVAVAAGGTARAQDWGCSPWEWVHPTPFPLRLSTVVAVNGTFWGFGESGVAVSRDGLRWQRKSLLTGKLASAMWTGEEFLGTAGNAILASSDGVSWSVRHEVWQDPIFFTIALRSIAGSERGYVAVGENFSGRFSMWSPLLLTSLDGLTWNPGQLPPASDPEHSSLSAVIWTKGRFVAVGSYLVLSSDGATWEKDERVQGSSLASDGDLVVVADEADLALSRDLAVWETAASPVRDGRIAFAGGRFWLAGRCTGCPDREPSLWSSTDARVWRREALPVPLELRAVAAGGSRVVAAGRGAAVSAGGGMWQASQAQVASALSGLAASGTRLVAVGDAGELLTSADGRGWERVLWGGATPLSSVVWGPHGFVAVGEGVALASADGTAWTRHSLPGGEGLKEVVSNGSRLLAISWGELVLASPDGIVWTPVDLAPLALGRFFFHDVVAGAGTLVASVWRQSGGGAILVSADGITWQRAADTRSGLPGLAWGGGRFLATDFDKVLASADGVAWQEVSSGVELTGLLWVGDRFVATDRSGGFFWSADGAQWQPASGPAEAGTVALGEEVWKVAGDGSIRRAVCGVPDTPVDLPSLAHLRGAQGTQWRSDVELHNPGDTAITVGLAGTARGEVTVGGQLAITLAAGEALRLDDVLAGWLGIEAAATARVTSWRGAALAVGRTYNDTPNGTVGQFIPPHSAAALEPGGEVRLIQLAHAASRDRGFRTNLGLVNLGSQDGQAEVELWSADGIRLGTRVARLRAGESQQLDDIFRAVTTSDVEDGVAVVRPAGFDDLLLAYASVVDNLSGDPTLVRPARPIGSGEPVWFPGAGHLPGLQGSVWRTDLQLHNPGSQAAPCLIELFPWDRAGGPLAAATVLVPPGEGVRLADVVGRLFAYHGGASLRLTPATGGVMASARTYAVGASGSFGQYVPALPESEPITSDSARRLIMLRQSASGSDGFRANLGLVNVTAATAEVEVELHDARGALLGTVSKSLGAFESTQITTVLTAIGAPLVDDGYAVVRVATPGVKVLAYACLIDNRSNDPVFMTALAP